MKVLEELRGKVTELVGAARDVVDAKCEEFRLKADIAQQTTRLAELLLELGTLYYYGPDDESRPENVIREDIAEVDHQLKLLKESYELVKPQVTTEPEEDATQVCYCRMCGKQMPADSVFCSKCGTSLDK